MTLRNWFRPPRHLLAMFLGITVVSTAALGWLSWELVRQDRALAVQRAQEQRENAAGLAVAALQNHLSEFEERLSTFSSLSATEFAEQAAEFSGTLTADSVLLILDQDEMEAHPSGRLLYYPVVDSGADPPSDVFVAAEVAEFQQKNYTAALDVLTKAAHAIDPAIRAEALVRLGRNHRKAGRWPDAIATYEQLAQMNGTVHGVPVDLLARAALCNVYGEMQAEDRLRRTAAALDSDLNRGCWRVSRAIYDVYATQMHQLLGPKFAIAPPPHAVTLSEAVQTVWQGWKEDKAARARESLWLDGRPFLVLSRRTMERAIVLVLGPEYLESNWQSDLQAMAQTHSARIALSDPEGHPVLGQVSPHTPGISLRGPSATGLPWTVHAISLGGGAKSDAFSPRSRIVLGGLLAMGLLVVGGSYLIARAVARELAVARLQSDFVTAVSHEFRTPLTALRQLSELLAKGRVLNEGVRQQYYEVLEHESARLHRLVEGLLNFGRMQAGAMKYNFDTIDAAALLHSVVEEFRVQAERHGRRIEFEVTGVPASVRADREALGCVVWNLLDNAVKYSPDSCIVWLELSHEDGWVAISVRDQGVGIPREEQARIFQKFIRGKVADSLGVQGAGIGLAVAREIVATHEGEIRLESVPGAGSTFTILLPPVTASSV